ncbi:hypothetical protein [Longimicrobium sp.]|uniref:hypothetical protein n=1 Tax=Longimicrobium sp. TaxID=2029185 RepID=UPI002E32BB4E|nr:hypothetical protein [Longimicrobium sp.]HEX6039171.1 hypothetical protein [Longimicrobium sp.]
MRLRFFALLAPLLACAPLLSACDENGLLSELILSPDTATVALPGASVGSALDIVRTQRDRLVRRPELLEDAEQWDVALRRTEAGTLVLRPFIPVGGGLRGAGLAVSNEAFEQIEDAPRGDGAYGTTPLPVTVNGVYLLRSRQFSGTGFVCVKYAKLKAVAVDEAAGTARFAMVINDGCDDERLAD